MRPDYLFFMAEAEGCTDIVQTKAARTKAAANEINKMNRLGRDLEAETDRILDEYNLTEEDLPEVYEHLY